METLFVITVFFAIIHFIYESIVLPSIRLNIRYKLFSIRDKIIEKKMRKKF